MIRIRYLIFQAKALYNALPKRRVSAIIDNQQITIAQMTERAGTTKRTVQRYLKELQDASVFAGRKQYQREMGFQS